MITIPLYTLLLLYFGFLLTFLFFSIVNAWHIVDTGTFTVASLTITLLVALFTIIIFGVTFFALQNTNWQELVTVWDQRWGANLLPTGNSLF